MNKYIRVRELIFRLSRGVSLGLAATTLILNQSIELMSITILVIE